jgi:hypothetical protein
METRFQVCEKFQQQAQCKVTLWNRWFRHRWGCFPIKILLGAKNLSCIKDE